MRRLPSEIFEAQAIARHDLPAQFHVVDAAQVHPHVRLRVVAMQQQHGRELRQRLEHQDAGHQRRAREVSLKEFFGDGDVLDGHEPAAGFVLGDGVDQNRRIPVTEPVEKEWER